MINPNLNPNRRRHPERVFVFNEGTPLSQAEKETVNIQMLMFGSIYYKLISENKEEIHKI
jgi:hypothetical protein